MPSIVAPMFRPPPPSARVEDKPPPDPMPKTAKAPLPARTAAPPVLSLGEKPIAVSGPSLSMEHWTFSAQTAKEMLNA